MRTVILDCGTCEEPTAATIDAIARLKLATRRSGCRLQLTSVSPALIDLLGFVGLGWVLGVEPHGQSPEREQPGGIEEERELGNPTVL